MRYSFLTTFICIWNTYFMVCAMLYASRQSIVSLCVHSSNWSHHSVVRNSLKTTKVVINTTSILCICMYPAFHTTLQDFSHFCSIFKSSHLSLPSAPSSTPPSATCHCHAATATADVIPLVFHLRFCPNRNQNIQMKRFLLQKINKTIPKEKSNKIKRQRKLCI